MLAALLILTVAGSTVWISARTLHRHETVFLDNTLHRMVKSLGQEWAEELNLKRAAEAAILESAPLGARVDILDRQGRTLASSGSGPGPRGSDVREARTYAWPGAWIVVTTSTEPRRSALEALSLALLVAALPLAVAASLAGRWLARRALRPLSRMTTEAERIAASGAVRPLGKPGDPLEIAALAASFDRLVARLDEMARSERHFTEDAAHELRTPLTVLSGELQHARSDPALGARQRESLEHAAIQVRAMDELVEALLFLRHADGSREESSEFAPVNLADLARDAVRVLLLQHPKRAADVAIDAADEVLVSGHPVLLASALRNLIANALKFTEPGQTVRITVATSQNVSRIVVEDGGTGVAPEHRESIFQPFYRSPEARASKEGFGLGLPILRRVARAHGGEVVVSSSMLGGARFELTLPGWAPSDFRSDAGRAAARA